MLDNETLLIRLTVEDRCYLANMLPKITNNLYLAKDIETVYQELVGNISQVTAEDWTIFLDDSNKWVCAPWKKGTVTTSTLNKDVCSAFKNIISQWQINRAISPKYAELFITITEAASNDKSLIADENEDEEGDENIEEGE